MKKKLLSFCLSIGVTLCMLTPSYAEEAIVEDEVPVVTIQDEVVIEEESSSDIEDNEVTVVETSDELSEEDSSEDAIVDISDELTEVDIADELADEDAADVSIEDVANEAIALDTTDVLPEDGEDDIQNIDMIGVWSGEYTGTINGRYVTRKIKLDVDRYSSLNGVFEGIANIDNGKNGIYAFSGRVDFEKGEISFKGDKWMNNVSDFSFNNFKGTLEDGQIKGLCDGNSSRPFILTKKSNTPANYRCTTSDIKKTFYGEYDGHTAGGSVTRRNVELSFTKVTSSGEVYGKAIVTPSKKAPAADGVNCSYKFKGTFDFETGALDLQGYQWIKSTPNFTFIRFQGYYDKVKNAIVGHTSNGIWSMPQDLTKKQTITVSKKAQKTITYNAYYLKFREYSFNISAKAKTKITYKVTSGNKKYVSVSKSGKVKLKRGTPKGTYKITVTAARTAKYKEATKVVTIKVK